MFKDLCTSSSAGVQDYTMYMVYVRMDTFLILQLIDGSELTAMRTAAASAAAIKVCLQLFFNQPFFEIYLC